MSVEDNKGVIRRAIEARNAHDLEAWVALFAGDWQERMRRAFIGLTASFPDVHVTSEEMIGEGNKVVVRWTYRGTHRGTFRGIPPTSKTVDWKGIDIWTVVDGKITSLVREADSLSILQQLGATVHHGERIVP